MEVALFVISALFLAREITTYRERQRLLDRIQAPAAVQERVTYEELTKLPTPEGASFDNDAEFNHLKRDGKPR